jgi:hypothetical protein
MQTNDHAPNLLELLDGISFPTTRERAVVYAMENDASADSLTLLEAIEDRDYQNMEDINEALGKMRHPSGEANLFVSQDREAADPYEEGMDESETERLITGRM